MLWPKIILFGDSLTQFSFNERGWGAAIADSLQRKCDVINRGFSGYNTSWARLILDKCIPKEMMSEVAAVTVFLGANDAALKDFNAHQHVSVDLYTDNMKAMLKYLLEGGLTTDKIILITPPPLGEEAWAIACMEKNSKPQDRSNANTGLYAKACCSVAKEFGTGLLDLWTLMQEDTNWLSFFNDGLHFSEEGSKFVAGHLVKMIEERTRNLPAMILPDWKDVDSTCPAKSLQS